MAGERKVVLITRRTRYEDLLRQYNTEAQARFVIESRGLDFAEYVAEHSDYSRVLKGVTQLLQGLIRVQCLERTYLPNYLFAEDDIVVVVGQDGLVANTLKYVRNPVIAVNPDPARNAGLLLPFLPDDVLKVIQAALKGSLTVQNISMAEARFADGQRLLAVNDLFIGPALQISARYRLDFAGQSEAQSSSGLIVSTGLGSSGWLTSVLVGAAKLSGNAPVKAQLAWDADCLKFVVREPFPSPVSGVSLVQGDIGRQQTLRITSQMPVHGVVFSDGMLDDCIAFNSGAVVQVAVAAEQGQLVV